MICVHACAQTSVHMCVLEHMRAHACVDLDEAMSKEDERLVNNVFLGVNATSVSDMGCCFARSFLQHTPPGPEPQSVVATLTTHCPMSSNITIRSTGLDLVPWHPSSPTWAAEHINSASRVAPAGSTLLFSGKYCAHSSTKDLDLAEQIDVQGRTLAPGSVVSDCMARCKAKREAGCKYFTFTSDGDDSRTALADCLLYKHCPAGKQYSGLVVASTFLLH